MSYNYTYEERIHPMTGDVLWQVEDIALAVGGVAELIQEFIQKYYDEDLDIIIFDNLTHESMDIECDVKEMPMLVEAIYMEEHATPLTFIGVNQMSACYVVGMTLSKGTIPAGNYKYEDGKLTQR